MRIEAVDFFYLAMPVVTTRPTAARMRCSCGLRRAAMSAGANARPRRSPRSRPSSARCRMASAGRSATRCWARPLDGPADIARIAAVVAYDSMDLLQARAHLVGRRDGAVGPARQGARRAGVAAAGLRRRYRRRPMRRCCSATRRRRPCELRARHSRATAFARPSSAGVRSAAARAQDDADQFAAAREGLGQDGILLVDPARSSVEDVRARGGAAAGARRRRARLARGAVPRAAPEAYGSAARAQRAREARGRRGRAQRLMARHLIDYGSVGYIQIDCGRIGGIGPAKKIADYAVAQGRHLSSTTPSRRTSRFPPRCSPMRASRIIASASIRRLPKPLALEIDGKST